MTINRKPHSEKTKAKISESLKDKPLSNIRKQKISEATKKAMQRPEIIKKIKLGLAKVNATEKMKNIRSNATRKQMLKQWNHPDWADWRKKQMSRNFKFSNTKPELEFKAILDNIEINYIQQYGVYDIEKPYSADFYLPDYNLVVEIDGRYWHNFPIGAPKDSIRTKQLIKAGYNILRYFDDEISQEQFIKDLADINKIKIYISSGWFSESQINALTYLESMLFANDKFKVYSPRKEIKLDGKEGLKMQQFVFDENCRNIRKADLIISSTVDKDMGTLFEDGLAYAMNKPIIYTLFDKNLKDVKFNLMLAQSGIATFTDKNEFANFLAKITSENYLTIKQEYVGEFE